MAEIFTKIPLIMKEIGVIEKSKKNPQQGYMFRGIDAVYQAVNSVLAKHEVFCVPALLEMKREERPSRNGGVLFWTILTMKYTFYSTDGSHVEVITVGEAMDSGDKSCNKAMSAAQKYAFLQMFCIPTEEPKDTELETHEVTVTEISPYISDEEISAIYELAGTSKHTNIAIKKHLTQTYGIPNIKTLPKEKLDDFIAWLTDRGSNGNNER